MKKILICFVLVSLLSIMWHGSPILAAQNATTLNATKTAAATWTRTFDWTIRKSVTHPTWNLFNGDDGTSAYTVSVTKSEGTDAVTVSGQVCVTNGGDVATENLTILDVIQTKSGTGQYTDSVSSVLDLSDKPVLAAGESHCYGYAIPVTQTPDTLYRNVAHVTITNHSGWLPGGHNCSGTEPCAFGPDPKTDFTIPSTPSLVNDTVHVTDTNGASWTFSGTGSHTYQKTFFCATDAGTYDNTATITETNQSASASVRVNCFDPDVTKTAVTSFDRTYSWSVQKTGNQTNLTLAKNEAFDVQYTVTPSATFTDGNWGVHGTITIHNSAPMDAVITSVSDLTDSTIAGTVTCPVTFPYSLGGGADLTCTYAADLPDAVTRTNVATAIQQNYSYADDDTAEPSGTTSYSGSAEVNFSETNPTSHDLCASVTDDKKGALGNVCANQSFAPFIYTLSVGPYATCGTRTFTNTATVTGNNSESAISASWNVGVNVPCILGCTLSVGYWKNHSGQQKGSQADMISALLHPPVSIWLGNPLSPLFFNKSRSVFTAGDAYKYLSMNVYGTPSNGVTKLYAQLIAAKLNIANGASNTVSTTITNADSFLGGKNYQDWSTLTKTQQSQALSWMTTLDAYNNGLGGVPHCTQ